MASTSPRTRERRTPMSDNFERIKGYYDAGFYTKKMLRRLVKAGVITADEYQQITGEAYA